jgi:ATP-dependent protease ClpP protease subunit
MNRLKHNLVPCFKAAVKPSGELEMLVYEEIGVDYWSGGGITAKSIRQTLDSAGPYSSISVRINSPGGDAFEGVAIGNVLKSSGKPVNVYIDGIAASAASIIAMAGHTVTMANNSMMMIHNAWSICAGDASDMTKMADTLGKISASIAQTYVDKTGKSMEDVQALMDAETWMSAEDCVEGKFATAIAEENEPAMAMARGFKVLGKLKHLPDNLKPAAKVEPEPVQAAKEDPCECGCDECSAGNCSDCSNRDCTDENCTDCPMQAETGNESNLSLYQAKLWMLQKGIKVAPGQSA